MNILTVAQPWTDAVFSRASEAVHPDTGATVAVDAPCYADGGLYVRPADGERAAETLSAPAVLAAQGTVEISVRYLGEAFQVGAENFVMAEGPLLARRR